MRLRDLFLDIAGCRVLGPADVQVHSVCYRSDSCAQGSLFFCVPGFTRDGHEFAADAVSHGAIALCVERVLDLPVAQVVVPSVRMTMGPVSNRLFDNPSGRLLTVGITGTNGKTTSAFLAAHLLDRAGLRSGLMGTVQRRIGGEVLPAGRTTPEAPDIQHDLAQMLEAGDRAAVMEVSSHALDLGRVLGVDFRAVAFTNLTQDHLDYHGDLESYFATKGRLFSDPAFRRLRPVAVVNVDDPYGRRVAGSVDRDTLLTLSTAGARSNAAGADLELSEYTTGPSGTEGVLVLRGNALRLSCGETRARIEGGSEGRQNVKSRLVGSFNVANTLTALGVGLGLGLALEGMLSSLEDFVGVPGRMETVDCGQPSDVIVDYAHTPDSVRNVLQTARGITRGRLIALVGCGGDRDKGKRPLMGRAAEELADFVVITSDNPRSEDPAVIISDILGGLKSPDEALVQPDRRLAIRSAIQAASSGDVVLILGKGHESGQEFANGTIPFDDRKVAREALKNRLNDGR
ncbi:MAG: UDP-N-acetylmuramoyl-L-alanyl-D-glutamate--2,6-diaminopimelate ligase [Actinobacteria bacterium]|nr:UDP-N-acetylmuramoyl-L-alanyl-D-glutamate--2,6-diaminopimelate ligase [Actinomycetota bacterium]